MHPFGAALEARDVQAAVAVLADDVVFNSPIVYGPYAGNRPAAAVLSAVGRILEDFAYEAELASEDGRNHALMFRARVDGKNSRGVTSYTTAKTGWLTNSRRWSDPCCPPWLSEIGRPLRSRLPTPRDRCPAATTCGP